VLLVGAVLPLSDAIDGEREASEAGGKARVDKSGSGSQGGQRGEEEGGGVRAPQRGCEAAHRCTPTLGRRPSSGIANASGLRRAMAMVPVHSAAILSVSQATVPPLTYRTSIRAVSSGYRLDVGDFLVESTVVCN
jgi:hypothetical protein